MQDKSFVVLAYVEVILIYSIFVYQKLTGDIVLNGQPVASSTLRKVAAYVRKDTSLCAAMTVEHTLRFHAALRRPRNNGQVKMDDRDRVSSLNFLLSS